MSILYAINDVRHSGRKRVFRGCLLPYPDNEHIEIRPIREFIKRSDDSGILNVTVDAATFMTYNNLQQRPFYGIHVLYSHFDGRPSRQLIVDSPPEQAPDHIQLLFCGEEELAHPITQFPNNAN